MQPLLYSQATPAQQHPASLSVELSRFLYQVMVQQLGRLCSVIVVLAFLLVASLTLAQATTIPTKELNAITQEITQKHKLDALWVASQLQQAQIQETSISLMRPALGSVRFKNWNDYRARFVTPERIVAGVAFWKKNRETLMRAQQKFGVPPEIIVSILGVETNYGQNMGSFRALDALATLAFYFPSEHRRAEQRARFFRKELGELLALAHRNQQDPLSYKSSYAGALGLPQFMPGSWRKYALDFDGDAASNINLFESEADAIGSIANYLTQHGWQAGLPTHYPIQVNSNAADLRYLLETDIVPSFTQDELHKRGITLELRGIPAQNTLALIELRNEPKDKADYVAGTKNFYVITRYNHSSYYAMAVIELAQAIKAHILK